MVIIFFIKHKQLQILSFLTLKLMSKKTLKLYIGFVHVSSHHRRRLGYQNKNDL